MAGQLAQPELVADTGNSEGAETTRALVAGSSDAPDEEWVEPSKGCLGTLGSSHSSDCRDRPNWEESGDFELGKDPPKRWISHTWTVTSGSSSCSGR